jgi:predicted ATP-dependent serine protease
MSQVCHLCAALLPEGMLRCLSCKAWNFPPPSIDDEESVLLSDASLEAGVERLDLGFLSSLFGKTVYEDGTTKVGIARTSVVNVAGPPGAGKTTLFLQMMDILIPQVNREGMIIATEQSAKEFRTTAKRIGTKHLGSIRIVKAMGGLRRDLGEILLQHRPGFAILDSLSKLVGEDLVMASRFAERFKDYSVELNMPAVLVNQVNSEGGIAGRTAVQHAGDTTMFLDKDDSDGERCVYVIKNRFGEAPKAMPLLMTPEDTSDRKRFLDCPYPGMLIPKPGNSGVLEGEEDE